MLEKQMRIFLLLFCSFGAYAATTNECPFLSTIGLATPDWDDFHPSQKGRDLRRYDHYNSGSASSYRDAHSRPTYASLSDIMFCLACALGWTVWMVSATRSPTDIERSVFEAQQSRKVHGNVLQVTLGEDADMTGIPIYHTLVDYVVDSETLDEEPLQIRKCFSTRKLLDEGFANVQVLVLEEDPTTSVLYDDFLDDQQYRAKQYLEPQSYLWTVGVYVVAATLITTSIIGGYHALVRLDPTQQKRGKTILVAGSLLLYPVAVVLYHVANAGYRCITTLVERPGVIIHGTKDYWSNKCMGAFNPLEAMGTFDKENPASPPGGATQTEMTRMNQKNVTSPRSPLYPNAGCGFGKYDIHMPTSPNSRGDDNMHDNVQDLSTMSASDVSSVTGGTRSNASTKGHSNKRIKSVRRATRAEEDEYTGLEIPSMVDHSCSGEDAGEGKPDKAMPLPGELLSMMPAQDMQSPSSRTTSLPTPLASNLAKRGPLFGTER